MHDSAEKCYEEKIHLFKPYYSRVKKLALTEEWGLFLPQIAFSLKKALHVKLLRGQKRPHSAIVRLRCN